ncbi:MAG: two-component regulator propeller domain-containing protein, partial [Pseudomonadota bacterium]
MNLRFLLALLPMALLSAPTLAAELAVTADAPFRTYSVKDGLNQKTVTGIAQDKDGVMWVATFGGLNRFDGKTFESFTTRQGLRQNLIQYLMVDRHNRLWAGDAGGGLTVIEDGVVTRVYEPSEGGAGVVRDLVEMGDTLYIAMQPGGLRRLSMTDPDATIEAVPGAPEVLFYVVPRGQDELLAVSESRELFSFRPNAEAVFEIIAEGITAIQGNGRGLIAVGSADGRVGDLLGERIEWYEGQYPAEVSGLTYDGDQIAWVFTERHGMSRFGDHGEQGLIPIDWSIPGFIDAEGVLWVSARKGLLRYLGERFSHYSLPVGDEIPEIFAVEKGFDGDYWFGTSHGILHVTRAGDVVNLSDALGLDRREVRGVVPTPDGRTLYAVFINGELYEIDLAANTARSILDDGPKALVSMVRDQT